MLFKRSMLLLRLPARKIVEVKQAYGCSIF